MRERQGEAGRPVLLVPSPLAARFIRLPLESPVRAWRSDRALLLRAAIAAGASPAPFRHAGARVFFPGAGADRFFEEAPLFRALERRRRSGERAQGDRLRPPVPEGRAILLGLDGSAVSVPDPRGWKAIGATVKCEPGEVRKPLPEALPGWELSLVPRAPTERDGVLCRKGAGARTAAHLAGLPDDELRDLRLGRAPDGLWFIVAARGLGEDFPRDGRGLRNLGTALEPVLIPADRRPAPRLGAREIRRLFGVSEGAGALWWDEPEAGAETCTIFRRSRLCPLDRGLILSERW